LTEERNVAMSRSTKVRSRRRAVRLLPKVLTVGITLNGLRLRARAGALGQLDSAPDGEDISGWVFVTAKGVELTEATKQAAVAYAVTECLDVVDLVPADLPVERILETLRMTDIRAFRTDAIATGRGAFQALAVSPEVAGRIQLSRTVDLDPYEMVKVTAELKRFAPESTDLAVAPGLAATPDDPTTRKAFLRALWGGASGGVLGTPVFEWLLLAAGFGADPVWGSAAVAAYSAQPWVSLGGAPGGLHPRDMVSGSIGRPGREPVRLARAAKSSWRSPVERDLHTELRPVYAELLEGGIERFFEDRRDDCPWCGGHQLTERIRVKDRLQHKPGTFVMDECGECGVVFQNPRLSLEGLDFYYRDFYDGLGEEQLESVFGSSASPYTGRAEMVKSFANPKRWLDVGTGHGHFCLVAKQAWPDTVFDGLDMSDSVEEAERRGWIDRAYRGRFPELSRELAGTYDVVSMHHYLEHVREPFAELDAATEVLVPGGLVLIELPDPESRWGRILGRAWLPWFQPQHQTMIPIANLKAALEERGFTLLAEDRGEANQPVELLAAAFFGFDSLAPDPRLPWGPEFNRVRWARRMVMLFTAVPVLIGAFFTDQVLGRVLDDSDGGNTYRVLARKADEGE
jgi:SAM-dependent methyltransferase